LKLDDHDQPKRTLTEDAWELTPAIASGLAGCHWMVELLAAISGLRFDCRILLDSCTRHHQTDRKRTNSADQRGDG
jgi:hypothetical protein